MRGTWRRYFRPMVRTVYLGALFHLLVLNFPFALVAWINLFVFTLVSDFRSYLYFLVLLLLSTLLALSTIVMRDCPRSKHLETVIKYFIPLPHLYLAVSVLSITARLRFSNSVIPYSLLPRYRIAELRPL